MTTESGRMITREGLDLHSAVEVNGSTGDVILAHPFLVHARSKNLGKCGVGSGPFASCATLLSHFESACASRERTVPRIYLLSRLQ